MAQTAGIVATSINIELYLLTELNQNPPLENNYRRFNWNLGESRSLPYDDDDDDDGKCRFGVCRLFWESWLKGTVIAPERNFTQFEIKLFDIDVLSRVKLKAV